MRPERHELAPGLGISRIVTGLWQVADMERGGHRLDPDRAAAAMEEYVEAGLDTFDMADHYGSAEEIAGRLVARGARPVLCTKWVPAPGPMTREVVRAAVDAARRRLGVERIDLFQFHWWTFEHPGYLDALKELTALREEGLIGRVGLTNFDTDHLRVLVKHGIEIASNQVCYSLLDRRAGEEMAAFCRESGVGLLAYGTLAGGFLSDRWLDAPEPTDVGDWSKMKYKRFVDAAGGWEVLQAILGALARVAAKHGVSVANVASRWVLERPAVAAIIVGARLGESEHRADNLRLFSFALDEEDNSLIDEALAGAKRIPGDCGDEYRRPPFLTASGDLSHHLSSFPRAFRAVPLDGKVGRMRIDSGSVWEQACGYSRAVRVGNRILVSGTTATHGSGEVVARGDVRAQAVYVLDKIAASVAAFGGAIEDVVRTRVYLRDVGRWEEVARVHGRYFGEVRPANTLVEARLVGDYEVEIEAEAVVSAV